MENLPTAHKEILKRIAEMRKTTKILRTHNLHYNINKDKIEIKIWCNKIIPEIILKRINYLSIKSNLNNDIVIKF